VSLPLEGVRVVEYAQYVAGLLCACLNLAQRHAFLALVGLDDPTVTAPDVVPGDPAVLAAKVALTERFAKAFAEQPVHACIDRLEAAGVPCGPVLQREGVHSDPQVVAESLVGEIDQDGLGPVRLLAPFFRVGGAAGVPAPSPALGEHTAVVLEELG
jgi:crotonobetainyl-CoA:carnitine CoA-transferase CaiB-like acyl-CoA transferase